MSQELRMVAPVFGDSHNFGRTTRPVVVADKKFYLKHRNLFWEWLLFGNSSPLIKVFSRFMPELFIEKTFGLEVNLPLEAHTGLVCEYGGTVAFQDINKNENSYYNIGLQCAYFTASGISDLLLENMKLNTDGLQVIDAECVLGLYGSIEDSLLLPRPSEKFDARYGLFPFFYNVTNKQLLEKIIGGFVDGILKIANHQAEIISVYNEELKKNVQVSVRILIRSTQVYEEFLLTQKQPSTPFLTEEMVQLERGDIPYFFKFNGDQEIYYYSTADYEICKLKDLPPSILLKTVVGTPEKVFAKFRLMKVLLPNSLRAFLFWCSLHKESFKLQTELCDIEIDNYKVKIVSCDYGEITFSL